MPVVEETSFTRLQRRSLHALRIATHPALMRQQVEFLRHGPSPTAPPVDTGPMYPRSLWRDAPATGTPAGCNVCGWTGRAFEGSRHVEGQLCPRCGSNAWDRFLIACFVHRTPPRRWLRVLETSPRMSARYRSAMDRWFTYIATDFDESAHRASVHLDLQDPDLPAGSLDVVLSAHVLEHVPDTDRALAGIRRLLAPGGRLYLQVPVLDGVTAPPRQPEYHQDHTPVFWRFGFDLADRLRAHGFSTTVLCTQPFVDAACSGVSAALGETNPQWDVAAMMPAARRVHPVAVLDRAEAERLGLWHSEQFVTFEGTVAAGSQRDRARVVAARTRARARAAAAKLR